MNDATDLIVGFIFLLAMIVVFAIGFGPLDSEYSEKDIRYHDDERLFLLNYLKTDVGGKKIADMIAFNENGDEDSLKDLQDASRNILRFYGFSGRDYVLRVKYPNGDVEFLTASQEEDLPTPEPRVDTRFGELEIPKTELGRGEKIRIPSINSGLITIELEVKDE